MSIPELCASKVSDVEKEGTGCSMVPLPGAGRCWESQGKTRTATIQTPEKS